MIFCNVPQVKIILVLYVVNIKLCNALYAENVLWIVSLRDGWIWDFYR